jgi:four helix bundle protein
MKQQKGFEDLIAWQKSRLLAGRIYAATRLPGFARDFPLVDQILRASVSIMSNIAEGFERGGRAEFHQALAVAKGSCGEVRSQLFVAMDAGYLQEKDFRSLYDLAHEVSRIVGGLQQVVKKQRDAKVTRKAA